MKRKFTAAAAFALCAAMLAGCAAAPRQIAAALSSALDGGEDMPAFSDMEYSRPELEELTARVSEAEDALAAGCSADDAEALLDKCYESYYDFNTMLSLARIRADQDTSDEYYSGEYNWCAESYYTVQQLFTELYSACAQSDIAEELEEEYFWEGFCEDYGGEEAELPDEWVELMQEESELIAQYYEEIEDPVLELDGAEVHLYEYLESADYDGALRAWDEYYRQYNPRLAEIYIELVKTRRALAESMGYGSYEEMMYGAYGYDREYTPEEALEFTESIKEYVVPVYEEFAEEIAYISYDAEYLSEEELLETVGGAMEAMGGGIAEAFEFMTEYGLYDAECRENKAQTSYQIYIDNYDAPFAFIDAQGDTTDLLTLSHEFGHFYEAYMKYGDTAATDLAECFSQGMEYLLLGRLDGLMDEDEIESLSLIKLADTLTLYVQQASFCEFERRVYEADDEELTAEFLNGLSLQTAIDYGYYDGYSEEYYAMSWMDITSFFEQPFYVISYPVSDGAAIQLYELELKAQGSGEEKYLEMIDGGSYYILEAAEQAGLESPLSAARVEKTAQLLEERMTQMLYGDSADGYAQAQAV